MGNKIVPKSVDIALLLISITLFVAIGFPLAHQAIATYRINYYRWRPDKPIVSLVDTSKMLPGRAVPILMYHGVIDKTEEANTSIDQFAKQLVFLKQDGYQTISLKEYDLFRQGKFVLPPKPIVITFDDGRKDSYYTTDDILRQLGFKATIFVATQKALENDPFYLSWDDLRRMRDSGRWEIEAHGRHSHEKVAISNKSIEDEYGRYLTSRRYLPAEKRLETDAEFKQRVEQDYVDNINDLKQHLGIEAEYLAVPLNDYGQLPVSNNPEAAAFNQEIVKKHFRMAFIEVNSSENVERVQLPVYNYKNDDPYRLRRLEMKNMSVASLKYFLDREFPSTPNLNLQLANATNFANSAKLDYGFLTANKSDGVIVRALGRNASGKVDFGDSFWDNYSVQAEMDRRAGRSISLLFFVRDDRNYLSFGLSDNGLFLRERKDGQETNLAPSVLLPPESVAGFHTYRIEWSAGTVTAYFDGEPVFANIPVSSAEGAVGIKIWGDQEIAEGVIRSLRIEPAGKVALNR